MRVLLGSGLILLSMAFAVPVNAMTRDDARMNLGGRAGIADPDERLERLAAAGSAGDQSHARPHKSARNVLRDDPYLREAYSWVDNK